jgi:hypothetical protein
MRFKLHHLLIGFVLFTLITSLLRNSAALNRNMTFYNQLKDEYEVEMKKNEQLKLKRAKSSQPLELERIVRDKLGLIKKGEEVIIIPTPHTSSPTP